VKAKSTVLLTLCVVCGLLAATGCSSLSESVAELKLGMTPDQVLQKLGKPFTVRAAKVYENKETTEVWEYIPPVFTMYPKTYWVFFENGQVVQWGEPGDFSGLSTAGTAVPVGDYSKQKMIR
jgi:hypothetical protein